MSVLINGMEMPKSCAECRFYGEYCYAKGDENKYSKLSCPLVPVHSLTIGGKLVRCKDCKWWDKKDDSPYGYCMAMKHGFVSSHWEIGIYRTYKGDFYCADGERR